MALITLNKQALPSGSILQVVRSFIPNSPGTTTTSSSFVASGIQASITPTASGNLIIVDFSSSMNNTSGIGNAKMYLKVGSGSIAELPGITNGQYQVGYAAANHNRYASHCFGGSYTATSTDALLFEPYMKASSSFYGVAHVNSSTSLTLTEVKV
jgi:hypothetical protein